MSPNVLQILSTAIKERRCLALYYDGQREVRVVEPHAIYSDEQGLMLDAYQTRGYSSSARRPPYWRPFRIKKIDAVEVMKELFQPRTAEGFSAARSKYKQGLIAIVATPSTPFAYPEQTLEIGPPRPSHLRRSV